MKQNQIFSAEELRNLIVGFLTVHGPAAEEEIAEVISILSEWRVLGAAAELAARGMVAVDLVDGEPVLQLVKKGNSYRTARNSSTPECTGNNC